MEYNKYRFQKTNDKKILHKVKKHWVVMSMALLMAIGGEAVATHVSAHADVNNNGQTNDSTNTLKNRLNQQLVQGQKRAQNNQSQNAQNNSKQASQINTNMISKQASVLHQRIVNNATAAANHHANLGTESQGRVNGSVNSVDNSAVNNKASQNQTTPIASASAKNSTVSSSAPINQKGRFNSAYQSYEAQMSSADAKVASMNDNDASENSNNANTKNNKATLKDEESNYFSGGVIKTGNDDGLNYKEYANGGFEFTDGTISQNSMSTHELNITINWRKPENAKAIRFDDNVNISGVIDMTGMLSDLGSLQFVNFGNHFDTSNVTDMSDMFSDDPNLRSINFGNHFDTSNVTNMRDMFNRDESLTILTFPSSFNTSKVSDMDGMFSVDPNLRSINFGAHFDTGNVTNMDSMFYRDKSLNLILPNSFNTSKVTDMGYMFGGTTAPDPFAASEVNAPGVKSIKFNKSFNTNNVNCMIGMFSDTNLRSLDLPSLFNTNLAISRNEASDEGTAGMFNKPSGMHWDSITINSHNTILENVGSDLGYMDGGNMHVPTMYKVLPEINNKNGKHYTSSTPNDFSKGNLGTFVSTPNPKPLVYSDIYNSIDGMTSPSDKWNGSSYASPVNQAQSNWAFVDKNGQVSKTPVTDNNGHVMVAPTYYGMTYKYNKANNSVDFISGTMNSNDLGDFSNNANSDIKNAASMSFSSDIDISKVRNMKYMLQRFPNLTSLDLSHLNTSNVTNMQQLVSSDKQLNKIKFSPSFSTKNVSDMMSMFNSDINLTQLVLPESFDTTKAIDTTIPGYNPDNSTRGTDYMFYSDKKLKSITIQSPQTIFSISNDPSYFNKTNYLHSNQNYYKQLSGKDSNGNNYTLNTPNSFSQGNVGTFVTPANPVPATITYSDIYNNIDKMANPASDKFNVSNFKYTTSDDKAPTNWTFVKADGHISNTPIKDGKGHVMVAPTYKGMTYKYNQAKNTVEFTGGTANQYANDANSDINNVSGATFDNGVDLSQVNDLNSVLTSDSKLRDLIISSDVNLGNNASLPSGHWINISSNDPQSVSAQSNARPGIWTRNAEMVDYILNGIHNNSEGHEIFLGPLNSTIKIGKNPLGLKKGYQVINPQNDITIDGDTAYVSVEDTNPTKVSTSVDVVYENNHGNTVANSVPVTLQGNDHNTVYFSPVDVAMPNGYQLDMSQTKSYYAYNIDSSEKNDGNWQSDTTPIIYFKGNKDNNDQVTVNQIVESPRGAVLSTSHTNVPVSQLLKSDSDNVGDQYTISTSNVKAPNNYPIDQNKDSSVTGEILASNASKTYLSQPTVNFYYVDYNSDAKRNLTVRYIDQDNNQVGNSFSDQAYVGSDVTAQSLSGVSNGQVPAGYTIDKPNAEYTVGLNNQDINIPITGDHETVNVEYDYNGVKKNQSDDQVTGHRVGDTVQLMGKNNHLPSGYQLVPSDQTDYKINYADANNGVITYQMKIEPTVKAVPVNFIDQNNNPVGTTNYSVDGAVGQTVTLPDAPKGYTYKDSAQHEKVISQSDITSSSDQFKPITVDLVGDQKSLPVNFVNAQNQIVSSTTLSNSSDQIGNNVSLELTAPSDYQINPNQNLNYTFTPNQISKQSDSKMNPLTVYISPTNQHYQLLIKSEEYPNHKNKSRSNNPVTIQHGVEITGADGYKETFRPSDPRFQPAGYSNSDGNKPITVEITDHGLINASDTSKNPQIIQSDSWNYHVEPGSITVQYVDSSDNQPVSGKTTISGNINTNKTVTKYIQPPAGYALDNDVQTNYEITPETSNTSNSDNYYQLKVHKTNGSKTVYYHLNFVIETPTGQPLKEYTKGIPITAKQGNTQLIDISDINASDFPNGDKSHYMDDTFRSTGQGKVTVTNNPSGLTPSSGTFYYYPNNIGTQPITVKYVDQNGKTLVQPTPVGSTLNQYYGEKLNVTDPSDGGVAVPDGYQLNGNPQVNYTVNNEPQNVTLYVEGDKVDTAIPVKLMHTSKTYQNQNSQLSDVSEIVYVPVQGRVGDPFSFNLKDFEGYVPTGYHFAEASDKKIGNTFNNGNYGKHIYSGHLTPSDVNSWHSDSWDGLNAKSDQNYWYQTEQGKLPLVVLQAEGNKSMIFNIFDTHNKIIDTITIGKDKATDNHGDIANLHGYDPAYNDPIDTSVHSPYKYLLPKGYYYDTNYNTPANPSQVRFGEDSDVGIHVAGKLENIHIVYKDANGNQLGSDYDSTQYQASDGSIHSVRVGDVVNIPQNNVPKGYHVDAGQPTQYQVNYADDPASHNQNDDLSEIGNITRTLTVSPNTETLPIKFVDQNNQLIGSDVVSDQIGKTIPLIKDVTGKTQGIKSMVPDGYTLNKSDSDASAYQNYQFSTDNINPNSQNFMIPITLHVTGKPATIRVDFVDGAGNLVSYHDVHSRVGDEITMPSTASDAQKNYGLSSNYDIASRAYKVVVQPDNANRPANSPTYTDVAVVGKLYDAHNLKVNVVYEHADGTKTSDNNVPVTITGRHGSEVHFNPADLAMPSGYQIDNGKGKTQTSYDVRMDRTKSDAKWINDKGQVVRDNSYTPTIYLQGVGANQKLLINQVIESPAGAIMGSDVSTVHVPVIGKVGDTYTVQPNDSKISVPKGTTLATNAQPNGTLNKPLTGKILENEINGTKSVYLSQPADTLYYVDPNATSAITVKYVNQDGNVVGTKGMPAEAVKAPLNMNAVNGNNVPAGYTYDNTNPTNVYYGPSNSTVYLKVNGQPASVNEEYYDVDRDMKISAGTPSGSVGDTVTLSNDNLPTGYHLVSGTQAYTFSPNDANASTRHTEKIQLAPNQMTLWVNFVDQNNKQVGQTMIQGAADDNSNHTISNVPVGYQLDHSGSDSYNFSKNTPNSSDTMPSDTVHVKAYNGSPINLQFQMPGYKYNVESDSVTGQYGTQVDAMNYMPIGYHLAKINSDNVKDQITNLVNNDPKLNNLPMMSQLMPKVLNRITQNGFDGQDFSQALDNVAQALPSANNLSDFWNAVENTPAVQAFINKNQLGALTSAISGLAKSPNLNQDYQAVRTDGNVNPLINDLKMLATSKSDLTNAEKTHLIYTFNGDPKSAEDNHPVIEVEPDRANVKSLDVNLIYQDPNGKQLSSDKVNVPVKTDTQGDFDITPTDASLGNHITGYTPVEQSDIKGNLIGKLNVTNNTKQTFVYKADPETMQIQFMNQNGDNLGNPENASGYYGQTISASQLSDAGVKTPKGYTLMNPNTNYQFANGQTKHVVMVNGNAVNDNATINVVENDPYGKQVNAYTMNEPISGQAGDYYEIDADQLAPSGYQAVAASKSDSQTLSGQINSDGKLSNNSATFVYQSTAATTGLKPIYLIYLANDQTVGTSKVEAPEGTYDGENINISDSIKAGVPSGYQVANNTKMSSPFSKQYPTTLYVNVDRKGNAPLSFTANVVQNFYSPYGKLLNVKTIPVSESGSLDQIYHISPKDYQVNGYTLKNNNSDTGIITANGLTPSTVVYDYVAESSSAKNSPVKPITVTFKDVDGGKVIGEPQRLDGTMDEMVNVFDRTTIPSDYHLVAHQNPFMTFGTKAQDPTFNVAINQSKIGKVTIMYYNANKPSDLVDQVTAEDPVGTDFDLKPYINNVPQNYQFKSLDPNPQVDQADGQDPTIQVVNGTRYVTMKVNPIVTNAIVYEDINSDQNPNPRPVSTQLLTGIEDSPINHSRILGAVPHGYHIVKLGSANPVLNGSKDVVWIQKDAPADSRMNVNYVEYDANGKRLGSDQKTVMGRDGDSFDLVKYENQIPDGFTFKDAASTGSMDYFVGHDQTITINVQKTVHHSHYGKVLVQFVKASNPSQTIGSPLISTGYNGDVFDATPFEHEAPEDYDYAGIVGKVPSSYDANNVQKLVIKVK